MRVFWASGAALLLFAPAVLMLPTAAAQTEAAAPTLTLDVPFVTGDGRIAVDGNTSTLDAPWTYSFKPGTAPAAGNTSLHWSVTCGEGSVQLVGAPDTAIQFQPGTQEYSGDALLPIHASPDTPGMMPLNCSLQASAPATTTTLASQAAREFNVEVAFRGELDVIVPRIIKQAGPQKQIPYAVEVVNYGNARTTVHFAVTSAPKGQWQLLLPDPLIVEPGASATAIVNVATPYHNLWNNEEGAFSLRAESAATVDPEQKGESVDFTILGRARGWYIPGPEPALIIVALALAAVVARRRA